MFRRVFTWTKNALKTGAEMAELFKEYLTFYVVLITNFAARSKT
jgi:hypothetical protein